MEAGGPKSSCSTGTSQTSKLQGRSLHRSVRWFLTLLIISLVALTATVLLGTRDPFSIEYGSSHINSNKSSSTKELITTTYHSNTSAVSPEPEKLQILLVTYGRSGSTFTSDLIRHSKDVFYTFEPLSFLQRNATRDARLNDPEPPKYWINLQKEHSIKIVQSFLTCNFTMTSLKALDDVHLQKSRSTAYFYECMQNMGNGAYHLQCYFHFLQACRNHRITFTKSIRFRPQWAEALMANHPSLKLIYLARDPRPTLYSQAKVFGHFNLANDISKVSALHCRRLEEDLAAVRQLQGQFPGRVKAIRYEDVATAPQDFTAEIYDFLGLPVTQELTEYVMSLTTPDSDENESRSSAKTRKRARKEVHDTSSISKHSNMTRPNKRLKEEINWKAGTFTRERDKTASIRDGRGDKSTEWTNKPAWSESRNYRSRINAKSAKNNPEKVPVHQAYSTHRDNPRRTMVGWRYETGIKFAKTVDAQCSHLYQELGYRTVHTQKELENTEDISLVAPPLPGGVFDFDRSANLAG